VHKQAVILAFAAFVLVLSAWFFDADSGVVLIAAGAVFGWMVRHISRRAGPDHAAVGALPAPARVGVPVAEGENEALTRLHTLEARTSSLRHDLRGILSPAYLTAERLLTHADPAAKRAGEMMMKTVERASERLKETKLP
jgi:signal transduction histidine kinase